MQSLIQFSTLVFGSALGWCLVRLFCYLLERKDNKINELEERLRNEKEFCQMRSIESSEARRMLYEKSITDGILSSKIAELEETISSQRREIESLKLRQNPKTRTKVKPNSIPASGD